MRNYTRHYYGRPVRENYRTRIYEDVDYEGGVPEVLTWEWVEANIPADATHVDIPYGVKHLGNACFCDCKSLASVTIPSSVVSMGEGCFCGCESLTNITIPDSVKSIGYRCFDCCFSLNSITIPNSVKSIGGLCFGYCKSLKSITIPSGVTGLGECCFFYCESLTNVTIPSSVENIERSCFRGCRSLSDVYYRGTESEAGDVEICSYNNPLLDATWHYNYTESLNSKHPTHRPIKENRNTRYTYRYRR